MPPSTLGPSQGGSQHPTSSVPVLVSVSFLEVSTTPEEMVTYPGKLKGLGLSSGRGVPSECAQDVSRGDREDFPWDIDLGRKTPYI